MPISNEGLGSIYPHWSKSTNELFFNSWDKVGSNEGQVYVTTYEVDADGRFISSNPVKWEGGTFYPKDNVGSYDVHPDGTKLLVRKLADVEAVENQSLDKIVLFQNFDEHLRKIAPTGKN